MEKMADLRGRKALVTGASGHIGGHVCRLLRGLGALVFGTDALSPDEGDRADFFEPCNLLDEGAVRMLAKRALEAVGGVDIFVHCAAFVGTTGMAGWAVPFAEQTVEAFDAAMRVNVTAAFVLTQELRESLARSGRGSVVFLSSIFGHVAPDFSIYEGTAMSNPVGYGVSKGGLRMLARYLAAELAPRVRVNTLSLGGVFRQQPTVFVERYEKRTPLGRMGREEDVEGPLAFLVSDMSAYVTGQDLLVDGGWTVW